MRHTLFGLLGMAWLSSLSVFAAEDTLEQGMVNPGYHEKPAWFKDSFLDIREDIAEATAEGRRLMLYFYQDGCPYCAKLLNDNFGNRAMADKTRAYFDVIAINLWGDREVIDLAGQSTTEKQFGAALKVQYTPTLLLLDEQGGVLLRINGYFPPHKLDVVLDYVGGKHEREQTFASFYAEVAPQAASGELAQIAGSLDVTQLHTARAQAYRPLLVLFEQRNCAECDELHQDILNRPAIATALSNLDLAIVDIWSSEPVETPDGRRLEQRAWARELQVQYAPSLVFFDTQGQEAFRTEAYLKSFHVHGAIDYVVSGAYRHQPNFQRFLQHRTEMLHDRGFAVDLMD